MGKIKNVFNAVTILGGQLIELDKQIDDMTFALLRRDNQLDPEQARRCAKILVLHAEEVNWRN